MVATSAGMSVCACVEERERERGDRKTEKTNVIKYPWVHWHVGVSNNKTNCPDTSWVLKTTLTTDTHKCVHAYLSLSLATSINADKKPSENMPPFPIL